MLVIQSALILSASSVTNVATAQSKKDSTLIEDCQSGKKDFLRIEELIKNLFDSDMVCYVSRHRERRSGCWWRC